jgi:hypothetical protein
VIPTNTEQAAATTRTDEERVILGRRAAEDLKSPALMWAHNRASTNAIVDFANSKISEKDDWVKHWGTVQGVQVVLDGLNILVQDGKSVEQKMKDLKNKAAEKKGDK